jgi:hypothetical protein
VGRGHAASRRHDRLRRHPAERWETTTSAAFYQLPAVSLPGQYAVQAQISSGWRSSATTITVSLGALGLYVCRTP